MVGAADASHPDHPRRIDSIAERVRELASGYQPPEFAYVPGADAALFLCAIDHRTGYHAAHLVEGEGPYDGSALLWALGIAAERRDPGLLSAASLQSVEPQRVERMFEIEGETAAGAGERARLWRDLARGLSERYEGSVAVLIDRAGSRLGGTEGLIARLAAFEAFADPLAKKSFLFAKIAARRHWFEVADPEHWEVCADNVLMRLALRSGLVGEGSVEAVRAQAREQLKLVAQQAEVDPPLLDDLLWELGRRDPDLLGTAGGRELREPPRPAGTVFY